MPKSTGSEMLLKTTEDYWPSNGLCSLQRLHPYHQFLPRRRSVYTCKPCCVTKEPLSQSGHVRVGGPCCLPEPGEAQWGEGEQKLVFGTRCLGKSRSFQWAGNTKYLGVPGSLLI